MGNSVKSRLEGDSCLPEIADQLARDGSALKFIGPEPALGVSRQDMRGWIRRWLVNQLDVVVIRKDRLES